MGISIEQLAESIAQRTLLQSLNVRAVVDADGNETGMFEVLAGGRRYRALDLLVKQKRMAKTQAVPCVVREGGIAKDDSLAENRERVGLHPLDQFRAFQSLSGAGLSDEDIAARHFVTPAIVKQRLRLASVSPKLHEVYAEDGMTLEQLTAFSVTSHHTRQEQVWENVSRSGYDEPYQIRRMMTENTVRASDRSVQFIGLNAYEQAGGGVLRDLFEHDDGGWLQDVALLDRLVTEKLKAEAETIAAEGWKWISVAVDFPTATRMACVSWRANRSISARRSRPPSTPSMRSKPSLNPIIGMPTSYPKRSIGVSAKSRRPCWSWKAGR
ncbi:MULTISPECIES: ParB/RepB/Spo0J family partition protein [unclassified Bradyrhizobium]|uniref:ParB/RepB/Spo0J family partition protein n=1 Tax=unclassified Bradyrhizobium TaxID=2631580 RepID=UPI001FF83DFE